MCIIIDANRLGEFLGEPVSADAAPIHRWLNRGRGTVVYSTEGEFHSEIGSSARTKLAEYVRAGKAILVPSEHYREDVRTLQGLPIRSDDAHVLALARASGARLLYTADRNLAADFKDRRFVNRPRGKVYTRAANAALLTRTVCRGR